MAEFTVDSIDSDVMQELVEEINELYQQCEADLIALERAPKQLNHQQSLFRAVHTIKGDLGIVGFTPMVTLVGAVEDLLEGLRSSRLSYSNLISDAVFIVLDQCLQFVESCRAKGKAEYSEQRLQQACELSVSILDASPLQQSQLLNQLVATLDPKLVLTERLDSPPAADWQQDLRFFRQLMASVEARSRYWHDRADRQLKLALLINRFAGDVVDQQQLTAACYIHDFGMGFMPLELLHQTGALSAEQRKLMQSHVYCSAKLLENMPQWQAAKMMVLQHHEQPDGKGYPLGLQDRDIEAGAKILAIVDTFDAMTHERAYDRHTKRPIQRALAEITRLAGTQLDKYWVTVFQEAVAHLLGERRPH